MGQTGVQSLPRDSGGGSLRCPRESGRTNDILLTSCKGGITLICINREDVVCDRQKGCRNLREKKRLKNGLGGENRSSRKVLRVARLSSGRGGLAREITRKAEFASRREDRTSRACRRSSSNRGDRVSFQAREKIQREHVGRGVRNARK